jgi:carbamate kinase
MGLEVLAAYTFIEHTGRVPAIASITETSALLRGEATL